MKHPIGIFDSGYGGLTVLKEIIASLPEYDFIYAGDNARSPYGTRSFETVYRYTLESVTWLFDQGCELVVLACNTASAKALRTIQQKDLSIIAPGKRVLGVIRPVTEIAGNFSKSKHLGIFATPGTVKSNTYVIEINKFFPDCTITQEACPMWVPLIENNEHQSDGADYFIRKNVQNLLGADPQIDTVILGCTHYPFIYKKIASSLPQHVTIVNQGTIVAQSLLDYLRRHPEIDSKLSKNHELSFFTSETADGFDKQAMMFFGNEIRSVQVDFEKVN
ncbi:MAG: glutamate racemase [Fibrobacterota bacterium]|nr:glutamate racemase [Chitinispirillaceae bacterium]